MNKAVELLKANPLRSYASVARELGVSRERIRQIANDAELNRVPEGYISLTEMARRRGYTTSGLYLMTRRRQLPFIRIGSELYVHVDSQRTKKCLICGKSVGRRRVSYCSQVCAEIGEKRASKRSIWRVFYRKRGLPLCKSISLLRTLRLEVQGE